MPDWLLITLFLFFPVAMPTIGLMYIYFSSRGRAQTAKFYDLRIAGSKVSISGKAIATIALWMVPIIWFEQLIPLPFFTLPIICVAVLLWVTRKSRDDELSKTNHSQALISSLRAMQQEIERAKIHIEDLASEVYSKQNEIDEKEKFRLTLAQEIDEKLKEVDDWEKLSESKKLLILNAASEVINKHSSIRMAGVVFGSILLNLAANVIWALLGQPGADRLLEIFANFKRLFS